VVDPIELRLVDVLMQVVGECLGRGQVMSKRLLDNDPTGLGQARLVQTLHHGVEQ
jgi:hypothetical protein